MLKMIYEVFEEFENAKTTQEKIDILRKNKTYALDNVLNGTFNPNITFCFKTIPEYKPSDAPAGLGYTSIHQELGRVYLFQENNPKVDPNLSHKRKEEILIQILESLEAKEAKIYANMLLKKQHVKGLTLSVVKQAFPDLIKV
jgi:hypothetical protein